MDFTHESNVKPGDNHFNRKGVPVGELNRGNRGKFSEAQKEERIKIHAIAVATGSPTIKQIVEIWKEKGIDITLQSEKEFRQSNRDKIEKKKHELIETGEIAVPVVSEEVLADNMMTLAIQTGRMAMDIRRKATATLRKIDTENLADPKASEAVKVFTKLIQSLSSINRDVSDQLKSLFTFSSKIKIKDKRIQQIVDERFNERLSLSQEEEEDEGDETLEITDEVRKKLLEN